MQISRDSSGKINSDIDLLQIFYNGITKEKKIGVECEKLSVNSFDGNVTTYSQVKEILNSFDKNNYTPVYENNSLIGLKHKNGNVSLEPGSQIEFSTIPFESVDEIKQALSEYLKELRETAKNKNITILDIGALPKNVWEEIDIIPKSRYRQMTNYLPSKGLEPFRMMRETAGIQVNLDYESEEDAVQKLSLALKLSPIVSAMYANSPFRNGRLTGMKSNRACAWLNVDEERCGFITEKLLFKEPCFSFDDYKKILLDIPMIFISRNNKTLSCKLTFKEFLENGFEDCEATFDDWNTHLSLFFPEVRLKDHLEIRNHDNQNDEMTLTVPALWKGILYFKDAAEELKTMLKRFDVCDFIELRQNTPIYALNYKIKGLSLTDIAKEIVSVSKYSLSNDEKNFLEPLEELVCEGLTPADIILKNELAEI